MKYLAAYTLLVLGGNTAPSDADVSKVIVAAGGEVDDAALAVMMGDLQGKDLAELLAAGETKIKGMGGGGGAAAPAAAGAAPVAVVAAPAEVEVDPMEGGMDMFGGGGGGGDY